MAVFTDEIAAKNITLGNTADWTVSTGTLPNGDNGMIADGSVAVSTAGTGNQFGYTSGNAWSLECWVYLASTSNQMIATVCPSGAATASWQLIVLSGVMSLRLINTGGAVYMSASGTPTTGVWQYWAATKATGADLRMYRNGTQTAGSTSTTGTMQNPSSTWNLYLGSNGDGGLSALSGTRMAKLAIYNATLTSRQILTHYLRMSAT